MVAGVAVRMQRHSLVDQPLHGPSHHGRIRRSSSPRKTCKSPRHHCRRTIRTGRWPVKKHCMKASMVLPRTSGVAVGQATSLSFGHCEGRLEQRAGKSMRSTRHWAGSPGTSRRRWSPDVQDDDASPSAELVGMVCSRSCGGDPAGDRPALLKRRKRPPPRRAAGTRGASLATGIRVAADLSARCTLRQTHRPR